MNVSALEKSSVCDVEFNVNCIGICSNFVKCFFVLVSIKKPWAQISAHSSYVCACVCFCILVYIC